MSEVPLYLCLTALEATQGQILSKSFTVATSGRAFEWELTKETIYLPLGCFQGGSAWLMILKLPSWVRGTNWSTFEREKARVRQINQTPKQGYFAH